MGSACDSPDPSPSSDLCTSCGMCCSGVVFDTAPLDSDEVAFAADLGLKPYFDPPGQARFDFPCRHLQGTRCGVYPNRPRICSAFRCELLKSFEAGQVSMSDAMSRVAEAKAIIDEVRPLVDRAGGALTPKKWGALLDSWRANALAGRATEMEALAVLQLAKLNRFLDTHFRSQDQQVVRNKEQQVSAVSQVNNDERVP